MALAGADFSLVAHTSVTAPGVSSSPDLAWRGSQAALVWVEDGAVSPEVHLVMIDALGAEIGTPVGVSGTSGSASEPAVDASGSSVLVVWTDTGSDAGQIHRAVADDLGAIVVPDAQITSVAGAHSPQASAGYALAAWIDDRDGTDRVRTIALDSAWDPTGTENEVAQASSAVMASDELRIALAAGGSLLTLDADGSPVGPIAMPDLVSGQAVAWGQIGAAVAGPASGPLAPGLAITLAGCASHAPCSEWIASLEPLETRTGHDDVLSLLVHDAALTGSFDARPVSYLSIQIRQGAPWSGPSAPGGFILDGTGYDDCGVCVLLYDGCTTSSCDRLYLARTGTVEITQIGSAGSTFAATLEGVRLDEVDIDFSSGATTWIEGGSATCFGRYDFARPISAL